MCPSLIRGGVEVRGVVAGDDDVDTGFSSLLYMPGSRTLVRLSAMFMRMAFNHLVVDVVPGRPTVPPGPGVEVVDEEATNLPLLYYVSCLAVPKSDQLGVGELSRVPALKLSCAHHDRTAAE